MGMGGGGDGVSKAHSSDYIWMEHYCIMLFGEGSELKNFLSNNYDKREKRSAK